MRELHSIGAPGLRAPKHYGARALPADGGEGWRCPTGPAWRTNVAVPIRLERADVSEASREDWPEISAHMAGPARCKQLVELFDR